MKNQVYASKDGSVIELHFTDRTAAVRKGGTISGADYHFDVVIDGVRQHLQVAVSRDAAYGISSWLSDPSIIGARDDEKVNQAAIDLCSARILEAVDREIDFDEDFQAYPDSFLKVFGEQLADLTQVRRKPANEIKQYISRRLYAAWSVGSESIEHAQLFGRRDQLYLRVTEKDLNKVIALYARELWDRHAEMPLLTATSALIKQMEQEAPSAFSTSPPLSREANPSYDVAFSFAGEDRAYVQQVAEALKHEGVRVFYDDFEKVRLWGRNLYEHLADVYQNQARYVVMFVSKHYAAKAWPMHERQSAQARALTERREYILPARFDKTEIPGLLPTTQYVDLQRVTPEALASMILDKLGRARKADQET